MDLEDELITATYEVPDLQVSDLQQVGPYYLPHVASISNLHFYQRKTKYEVYYRVLGCIKRIQNLAGKFQRREICKAFGLWKMTGRENLGFLREIYFAGLVQNTLKTFGKFYQFVMLKKLWKWKWFVMIRNVELKAEEKGKEVKALERNILHIEDEVKYYEKAVQRLRETEKVHVRDENILKEAERTKAADIEKNRKLLKSLYRENAHLREKTDYLEDSFIQYISTMSTLVRS